MRPIISAVLLALLASACRPQAPSAADPGPDAPAAAALALEVEPWTLPAPQGAAQPDLVATNGGDLLLSWVVPEGEGHALAFSRHDRDGWQPPGVIARGEDWFVNWADTPHLMATADGALWAHWLQKSAAATYAYDVALVRSGDGGTRWSEPVLVNDDGTPTEHGFASLWPASDDSLGIAWLDGRETMAPEDGAAGQGGHAGHGEGAMTLRAARFDAALARSDEQRLDAMVCDCCQTDVARGGRGPLLVYRDRTPGEIRDIQVRRLEAGGWSQPAGVHADQWRMPACPVNGPAIAADGDDAVVGWYTGADEMPTLKLARSADAGASFQPPLTLDSGQHVQGRVDVAMDDESVWALWMREAGGTQSLELARYSRDLGRELHRIQVATLQGRGRGTGFPQLAVYDDVAHVVWTDLVDGQPRLLGARIRQVAKR
ncbi:MAG: glycoside hydrolase [Pseudomonadota bacterium]|nr:glycoside hydrolase [Pseudomonadota bacterium]